MSASTDGLLMPAALGFSCFATFGLEKDKVQRSKEAKWLFSSSTTHQTTQQKNSYKLPVTTKFSVENSTTQKTTQRKTVTSNSYVLAKKHK